MTPTNIKKGLLLTLILLISVASLQSQQVITLYFLENAPMRHIINPAFQTTINQGYLNFSPLGYTSIHVGNNSLTLSDIYKKHNGKTVLAIYPGLNRNNLMKNFKNITFIGTDITTDIFSFGFQHKRHGYFHFGLHERAEVGVTIPKNIFNFLLNGGMTDVNGTTTLNLKNLDARAFAYAELYGGYSYHINERWTVGAKSKFLLGQAYTEFNNKNLQLDINHNQWYLRGKANINIASPIKQDQMPESINYNGLKDYNTDHLNVLKKPLKYLIPQGYGAAFDLGATFSPVKNLQLAFSITDLGFICWNKGSQYNITADSSFTGIHNAQFGNYYDYNPETQTSSFNTSRFFKDTLNEALKDFTNALHNNRENKKFTRMISPKLIVGLDYTFCKNILNIGFVSKTRLFDNHIYQEVTLGGAVRPCKWFNFALSYSLIQNGKYSNIGAGLSLIPYEGINMTLALDYIPLNYYTHSNKAIPSTINNVNLLLGFSIVWGTNKKKDKDKDGVPDIYDLDTHTPKNTQVDTFGCSLDSDADQIPNYLDSCPNTHYSKYGLIDSLGCPFQSPDQDGDGIPDDIDICPNTPKESYGLVDSLGCSIDSDNDGIPDYLDKCPNTPQDAIHNVDNNGCPTDSDNDGVPDYIDQCPNTPAQAAGYVDQLGCIKDTDGDSVPDYLDKCPFKPGPTENNGCPMPNNLIEKIEIGKSIPIHGIQFQTGKDELVDSSYTILNEWLEYLLYDTEAKLVIEGHTDNTGDWASNVKLSEKRAFIVHTFFIQHGIDHNRLEAIGYGPSRPIAPNSTPQGRKENRRVEFKVLK